MSLKTKFRYYSFGAMLYFCFSAPTYWNIDTLWFLFPCYFWVFCLQKFLCSSTTQSVICNQKNEDIRSVSMTHFGLFVCVLHEMSTWFLWQRINCMSEKNALVYCNQFPLLCSVFRKCSTNKGKTIEWDNFFLSLAKNLLVKKLPFF